MTHPELGVALAAFADRTLDEALEAVCRLEVGVVDLPTDSVFAISRPSRSHAEIARRLAETEIRVACVSNSRDAQLLLGPHGPQTDPVRCGSAEAKADHARRAAIDAIRLAATVGAPHVRLMLGCPDFGRWLSWSGSEVGWADNVAAFVEAAAPLARQAERLGVALCVEPHVKQVPFDAASLSACVEGLRQVGCDLAWCFDPANVAAVGFDPVDFLASMASTPVCVHAKDIERSTTSLAPPGPGWVRYGPQPAVRFRSVPSGMLDWAAIVSQLQQVGFRGPVLIEHEDVLIAPEVGIAEARRYLSPVLTGPPSTTPWW